MASVAVCVETFSAMVLLTITTLEASSTAIPPPWSVATLLTMILLRMLIRSASGRRSWMPPPSSLDRLAWMRLRSMFT